MATRLPLVCQNVLVKTSHIYGKTRVMLPSGLKALLLVLGCRCPKRHSAEGCEGPPGDMTVRLQVVSILCNFGESFNSFPKGCIFVFFCWYFVFVLSCFLSVKVKPIETYTKFVHMDKCLSKKKKTLKGFKKNYTLWTTRKIGIFVSLVDSQYLVSYVSKISLILNWAHCLLLKGLHFPVSFAAICDHVTQL